MHYNVYRGVINGGSWVVGKLARLVPVALATAIAALGWVFASSGPPPKPVSQPKHQPPAASAPHSEKTPKTAASQSSTSQAASKNEGQSQPPPSGAELPATAPSYSSYPAYGTGAPAPSYSYPSSGGTQQVGGRGGGSTGSTSGTTSSTGGSTSGKTSGGTSGTSSPSCIGSISLPCSVTTPPVNVSGGGKPILSTGGTTLNIN